MLRSLPSAIDDALDTLYEPNAVFSQFLRSADMTFFLSFPFLASSSCLVFSFLSFPFSFFRFLVFFFLSFIFFLIFAYFIQLTCVCRAMRSGR